jgi:hypothetical protein
MASLRPRSCRDVVNFEGPPVREMRPSACLARCPSPGDIQLCEKTCAWCWLGSSRTRESAAPEPLSPSSRTQGPLRARPVPAQAARAVVAEDQAQQGAAAEARGRRRAAAARGRRRAAAARGRRRAAERSPPMPVVTGRARPPRTAWATISAGSLASPSAARKVFAFVRPKSLVSSIRPDAPATGRRSTSLARAFRPDTTRSRSATRGFARTEDDRGTERDARLLRGVLLDRRARAHEVPVALSVVDAPDRRPELARSGCLRWEGCLLA